MVPKILFCSILIFFMTSCFVDLCPKECDQFTTEELSWLPYKLGDTLKFRSNLGNEETWIITNQKKKETNYGELTGLEIGGKNCHLTYYYSSYVELYREKDSTTYETLLSKIEDFNNNGGYVVQLKMENYYNEKVDNSMEIIELPKYGQIREIDSVKFKKNIGLFTYKLKDSNEIYEKY